MANIPSSKKRARQMTKLRLRNSSLKSRAYTFIKGAQKAIETKAKTEAGTTVKTAMREIDKAATKGIFHANKAARLKSRLHAKLKQLSA